jgi:hypothetical protein
MSFDGAMVKCNQPTVTLLAGVSDGFPGLSLKSPLVDLGSSWFSTGLVPPF